MLKSRATAQLIIILVISTMITTTSVIASGFTVGFWPFNITVEEPIHCIPACDGTETDLNLFPGETQEIQVQIFNRSDVNLEILFNIEVTPDDRSIEVTIPDIFLVPGRGDTTQRIFIHATERAEPGEYRLVIGVDRGKY